MLLAAYVHGVDAVAKCALDFAGHGMIEHRHLLLFQGAQLSRSLKLDEYCTVIPYSEVFSTLNKASLLDVLDGGSPWVWPPETTENLCAVDTTYYEFRHTRKSWNERYESALLREGVDTFAFVLGLEALFKEAHERFDHRKIIARRASWHFSDSTQERSRVRDQVKSFYDRRNAIVHGEAPKVTNLERAEKLRRELMGIDDLVRASLKTIIRDKRPTDWRESQDHRTFRHNNPPRKKSGIPSWKSDALTERVSQDVSESSLTHGHHFSTSDGLSRLHPSVRSDTPPPVGGGSYGARARCRGDSCSR